MPVVNGQWIDPGDMGPLWDGSSANVSPVRPGDGPIPTSPFDGGYGQHVLNALGGDASRWARFAAGLPTFGGTGAGREFGPFGWAAKIAESSGDTSLAASLRQRALTEDQAHIDRANASDLDDGWLNPVTGIGAVLGAGGLFNYLSGAAGGASVQGVGGVSPSAGGAAGGAGSTVGGATQGGSMFDLGGNWWDAIGGGGYNSIPELGMLANEATVNQYLMNGGPASLLGGGPDALFLGNPVNPFSAEGKAISDMIGGGALDLSGNLTGGSLMDNLTKGIQAAKAAGLVGQNDSLASILGKLGPALLGAYASNQQSGDFTDLARRYEGYGLPSRMRFESSFQPGFSMANDPGFTDALNQAAKATLHGLSVQGNPADSPNAWDAALGDLTAKFTYPALQNFRQMNAEAGGLRGATSAAANFDNASINANRGVFDSIGAGAADIFNPPKTLAQTLAEFHRLTK